MRPFQFSQAFTATHMSSAKAAVLPCKKSMYIQRGLFPVYIHVLCTYIAEPRLLCTSIYVYTSIHYIVEPEYLTTVKAWVQNSYFTDFSVFKGSCECVNTANHMSGP